MKFGKESFEELVGNMQKLIYRNLHKIKTFMMPIEYISSYMEKEESFLDRNSGLLRNIKDMSL